MSNTAMWCVAAILAITTLAFAITSNSREWVEPDPRYINHKAWLQENEMIMTVKDFDNEKMNLEILVEEAAEVIQIKSKCIRFGMDDFHPKNGDVNRKALAGEIGHFLAMVDILISNGTISELDVENGRVHKMDKLAKWYYYQKNRKE